MDLFRRSHWKRINLLSDSLLELPIQEREAAFAQQPISDLQDVVEFIARHQIKEAKKVLTDYEDVLAKKLGTDCPEANVVIHEIINHADDCLAADQVIIRHNRNGIFPTPINACKNYAFMEKTIDELNALSKSITDFITARTPEEKSEKRSCIIPCC